MELGRVIGILPVGALKHNVAAADVAPLVATNSADRIEDDSCDGGMSKNNRGMEDEEAGEPLAESDEANPSEKEDSTPENHVNFFG
jgi:hypothetical protein